VTVHNFECQRLLAVDPQRHIDVSWDMNAKSLHPVKVEVLSEDRHGLLAAMSKAISETGVNIANANVRTLSDQRALNVFEVMVTNAAALNQVIRNLSAIRGVVKVDRVKE
jgi:(p)ppGpp synthase/HD superfamily hydrolase